jgi:hypothetical protein
MTCGREHVARRTLALDGAAVSHLAELVRGECPCWEGPLIRPVSPKASLRLAGPPSPQGEKGRLRLASEPHNDRRIETTDRKTIQLMLRLP